MRSRFVILVLLFVTFAYPIAGVHAYGFVQQATPSLEVVPSLIEPVMIGDIFAVNVAVADLNAAWEAIAFNFSIAWNTTLMVPTAPYFEPGTFLETFEYYPDTIMYSIKFNAHDRLPPETPLPPDYNYSQVSEIMLPDPPLNGSYHAPFPSGGGILCTFYFAAIYDTVFPSEVFSRIDFIAEDVFIMNALNESVGYSSLNGAIYRAPIRVLGLNIDVYGGANNSGHGPGYPDPFPPPFGGQGFNAPMDVVFPESEITLYASVTYDEGPVQQENVTFELEGPSSSINLTVMTDTNGTARITCQMPWSSSNPENYTGLWNVTASVLFSGLAVSDLLTFFYEYPVHFATVYTDKYSYNNLDTVQVTVIYSTHALQWYSGMFMSILENSSGTPVSWSYAVLMFGGATFGVWKNSMLMTSFMIPFGISGHAYVHENCYDQDPSSGGVQIAAEYEPPPEILIGPSLPLHDVAVTNVESLKTVVGMLNNVSAQVGNEGQVSEKFNITAYANDAAIGTQEITLDATNVTTLTFTWNSTGFADGNYSITVYAWPVPGETNTANNNFTCIAPVHVGVPGDVSSSTPGVYDKKCDMKDIAYLVILFNTKPSSPNWNPNADVDNNGVVNMIDIAIAIHYFNQHE